MNSSTTDDIAQIRLTFGPAYAAALTGIRAALNLPSKPKRSTKSPVTMIRKPGCTSLALTAVFGTGVIAGCEYCQPLLMAVAGWEVLRQLAEMPFPTRQPQS